MKPEPGQILPTCKTSRQKVLFRCGCGRNREFRWCSFQSGKIRDCKRCKFDYVFEEKFGSLKFSGNRCELKLSQKYPWSCDCGKKTHAILSNVISGRTTSCGKCKVINIKNGDEYGRFKYIGADVETHPHSTLTGEFLCHCGKKFSCSFAKIDKQKSCGKCHLMDSDFWSESKFGRLKLKNPRTLSFRSTEKEIWLCDCGLEKSIKVDHVTSGSTRSCGACRSQIVKWVRNNFDQLVSISKWDIREFPVGGIIPLENIKNSAVPFKAECPICTKVYTPRLSDIRRFLSLTCGCSTSRVSSLNVEVSEYINSLGFETILEHKVDNMSIDIFVPRANLCVEVHGLRFHANDKSRKRDLKKYERIRSHGSNFLCIFEDEWKFRKPAIQSIIKSKIGVGVESVHFECLEVPDDKSLEFRTSWGLSLLDEPEKTVGAFSDGLLVAQISFSPLSQIDNAWEIAWMDFNSNFFNPSDFQLLFKYFLNSCNPSSVVGYSDNRFGNENWLSHIGFRFVSDVQPTYFSVENNRRVPPYVACDRKIWDLGKKKFLYMC